MLDIKLCVFDVDGVLIDSKLLHYSATAKALLSYGYQYSQQEDDDFGTIPTRCKLNNLADCGKINHKDIDIIWKLKEQYSQELFDTTVLGNFEVISLFKKLQCEGIKIILASNARQSFIERVVKFLGIMDYVEHILSAEFLTPKPDPEIYLTAMKMMNVSPKETIIFEDSEVGKTAAYASGANVYEIESYDQLNSSIFNNNEINSSSW